MEKNFWDPNLKIQSLIITCDKNGALQSSIRETFAKDFDSYLFLGDSFSHDTTAFLGLPVGYQYVPFKLAYGVMSCNSQEEFDFYFFQDDDTYVDVKALKEEITNCGLSNDKPQCLGRIFRNYGQEEALEQGMPLQSLRGKDCNLPVDYPSGGAGFVVNRVGFKAIRNYLRDNTDFATAYNSDISIGLWMRNVGNFEMIHSEKFRPDSEGYSIINDSVSFHYMNHQKINELYQKSLAQR